MQQVPPTPRWALPAALVPLFLLVACSVEVPDETPEATLPVQAPADDEDSCQSCHPRQFAEWLGSSHNYGNALDATYQSLEVTANYYAAHALGQPAFRQNLLCISCHAPSAAAYMAESGVMNSNMSLREVAGRQPELTREIRRPENAEFLLPPPGRAVEMMDTTGLTEEEARKRKQLTFQGITCDSCHKARGPLDDRFEEGTACDDDSDACAKMQFEICAEDPSDPRCKRRSKGGHPHDEPFFDIGIANFAFLYEREGDVRYGPFPGTPEQVIEGTDVPLAVPATAHTMSSGDDISHNMNIAVYPNGKPFPNQDPDHRPYLQSSLFCGSCHDVRLDPLVPDEGPLEPIHDEPFLRLENLYTEWFVSPLNLYPDEMGDSTDPREQWPDNPYRNEDGSAKRLVCQDCHMSLYPYAPPGTFPGAYTHCDDPNDPDCGLTAAIGGARANLSIPTRKRLTTHNMTGVDIALGHLTPIEEDLLGTPATMLPNQTTRDDLDISNPTHQDNEMMDAEYGLPLSLDARRVQQLETAVTVSLGGTPEVIVRDAPLEECEDTKTCCNEEGVCSLPVKAWVTNVNGGHNIAAGFSQERQIWVELTVQDMGRTDSNGDPALVDCTYVDGISEFYEDLDRSIPTRHTADSATDLFNRMTGIDPVTEEFHHEDICRGLSGHLIDKPHTETTEMEADGLLDDEDILLHRIGNTLPEFTDGSEAISWHTVDLGFDYDGERPQNLRHLLGAIGKSEVVSEKVARKDQFHIIGLDPFSCQLTQTEINRSTESPTDPGHFSTIMRDGSTMPIADLPDLKWATTLTPDERVEILYPFPELESLTPHFDDSDQSWHLGERFGLAYITNIFYQMCGCEHGNCEGPKKLTIDGREYEAQVPWVMTYPAIPHVNTIDHDSPEHDNYHYPVDYHYVEGVLEALEDYTDGVVGPQGSPWAESFTFIPLNSDHMPNNRSLKMYKPQRHYWDIRVGPEVVGPIRVKVRVWYRHFPPEFLRLMARFTESIYYATVEEGLEEDYYPHGPLVVEGENAKRWNQAANIDNLRRVLLDESEFMVHIGERPEAKEAPTFVDDVKPILDNHCVPCHSDVLRHGNLILDYDDYDSWDYARYADDPNPDRDERLNLVDAKSLYGNGVLVSPGNPSASILWQTLTQTDSELKGNGVLSRAMPLKTDRLSEWELETIQNWISSGAN